ncbi:ferredoxin [Actinomadura fulvescens]|uniref:Ferredoxin n=1 Tax=Actinomadura fulvescens TaxID=46160 RepID=A0ABP6C5G3_9ACTN
MRIVIDRELCIGAGQCVLSAPELFEQSDDDGRVLLRESSAKPAAEDGARTAAHLCPSGALSLASE